MNVRDQIVTRIDKLSPELQEQVLQFVTSLAAPAHGESGAALRRLSGALDPASAQEMIRAIEDECELPCT